MPFIPPHSTILVVGGGSGWILAELLKTTKPFKIVYIDSSEKMIALAKKRSENFPNFSCVTFVTAPIEYYTFSEKFDVLITPFLLDLFEEEKLKIIFKNLQSALSSDGSWLCSDFRLSDEKIHRYWQKILLKTMYLFFRITSDVEAADLPPFERYFKESGMEKRLVKRFYHGMIESALYKP